MCSNCCMWCNNLLMGPQLLFDRACGAPYRGSRPGGCGGNSVSDSEHARSPPLANLPKLYSISDFCVYGLMCRSYGIDSGLLLEREHTLGNAWEQWDHLRKVLMYGVNSPLYLLKFHAEMVPVPGTVHGERRTIVPK